MAYQFGVSLAPQELVFLVPPTPGPVILAPIPPAYDDMDHVNGMNLEPRKPSDRRRSRAVWNSANGELAQLCRRR